jgi:hypothetical protein
VSCTDDVTLHGPFSKNRKISFCPDGMFSKKLFCFKKSGISVFLRAVVDGI